MTKFNVKWLVNARKWTENVPEVINLDLKLLPGNG